MIRPLIALGAFLLATGAGAQTTCRQRDPITGDCLDGVGVAVTPAGGNVTGTIISPSEPATSHLIEYTGSMFRHDGLTASACEKLKAEIENKTHEHAECIQ
jgi:hypothetical protein